MSEKFPSLSSFLKKTASVEKRAIGEAFAKSADAEVQKILNESAVKLSVYGSGTNKGDIDSMRTTAEIIQEGVRESVARNSQRVKSILEDLFSSISVDKEREAMWINKLCILFNISDKLSIEDKSALIEQQLASDPDTLNYVTYLIETGEKKMKG